MTDAMFYTIFDPDNELYWTSNGKPVQSALQATRFFTHELAQEGIAYANWDPEASVHYVIMKHRIVSERYQVR